MQQDRVAGAPTLYEIFLRNQRRDLHKWHHYFEVYERYLAPYRGKPVRLVEIGVARGGSLRMWREYLGPAAVIYGVEIDPSAEAYATEGFNIFIGDQSDPQFLKQLGDHLGEVDIVLDDGGHTMAQQVNTFEALYPITKDLYIVEDTHTSYSPEFQDRPAGTFIEFAKAKIDLLYEWYNSPQGHRLYRTPPSERKLDPPVSEFCARTRGISFYDSIVVFEKGRNAARWSDIR
jgi:hypothetical protein